MAKVSTPTRAIEKAHHRVLKGFDRASRRIANLQLGEEEVDPRTKKKRMTTGENEPGLDTKLSEILYRMRSEQQ
jgi:hypothetical protein